MEAATKGERKTQILKGAAGLSSATVIAISSYFYSFFSEKIPNIEHKINLVEQQVISSNYNGEKNNKELVEKVTQLREELKEMRQTQQKIFEILIRLNRKNNETD